MVTTVRHVPRLRYRPTTRRDLPECFELSAPSMGLDDELAASLPALWDWLIDRPSAVTAVMEDLALPAGQRIQGWGVTMLLPQAAAQAFRLGAKPEAFVARRIYAALSDHALELMGDSEIGAASANGTLTMMIMHFSQHGHAIFDPYAPVSDPYVHSVISIANDAFRAFHDGYNLHAIYYETAAVNHPIAVSTGFEPLGYANEEDIAHLPVDRRPAFFGLARERARLRMPGSPARNCFEHHPPLFRFSASQRRLLWLALFDDSDEALTPLLGVSTHGLKKLWRGIYERIEDQMPEFFGVALGDDDGRRGPEKRRQVLAYVRQRPEELRPWFKS